MNNKMGRKGLQYLMVGTCSRCGKEFVRSADCDAAACDCESANIVPLRPVLILSARMYQKFERIANRASVSVESLIVTALELALENDNILKAVMK